MSIQEESGAEIASVADRIARRLRSVPWQGWAFVALTVFNLYGVLIHVMWRDEMQQWNIVRASESLADLVRNLRYEGHPWLWYLLIWPLSKLSRDPLAVKLFHFAIAFSSSLIVMVKAPFRRSIRLLIVAGYFFSFEYMVITRSYALGVLLAVCWCAWGGRAKERPFRSASLLGLLANTSVYGAMLSCVLALGEAIDIFRSGERGNESRSRSLLSFGVIFGGLLIFAFATMAFAKGGGILWMCEAGVWNLLDWVFSFYCVAFSLFPIQSLATNFWNMSPFWCADRPFLSAAFFAGFPVVVSVILWKDRMSLFLFMLLFLGVFLFTQLVFPSDLRHTGIVFIGFVVMLWRWHPAPASDTPDDGYRMGRFLLILLLLAHVTATAVAGTIHLMHPFSMGKATAQAIRDGGYDRYPIVAHPDFAALSVIGYLDRPFHFASTGRPETFVSWSYSIRKGEGSDKGAVSCARAISAKMGVPVLLLANRQVPGPDLVLLFTVEGSIVEDEQFFVYMLPAPTGPPPFQ